MKTSLAPRFMLALMRTQRSIARWAASRADLPPVVVLTVGARKPHRPEEQGPLPVDRQEQRLGHELANQLRHQAGRDDVFLPLILQLDDREVLAILRRGMHPDPFLRTRLANRDGGQELLDPDRLGERLTEPQIVRVERVERGGGSGGGGGDGGGVGVGVGVVDCSVSGVVAVVVVDCGSSEVTA